MQRVWAKSTAAAWQGTFGNKGDMIQQWSEWVFSHEGTFGETLTAASVCLQLWINSVEGREPVWWKETCIPAGWQASELGRVELTEPGETSCCASSTWGEHVSPLISRCHSGYFVYLPGHQETETNTPLQRKLEVRGSPPEAGIEFKSRFVGHEHIYPHKYYLHRQHLDF